MLFHRMGETPVWHCCLNCSVLRVSQPYLLQDQDGTKPAAGELCEECQAILLEGAVDRLLELESRIVETKANLKIADDHPLHEEAVREHIEALRTSLLVMDEYRALIFTLGEKGEP